jgi:hypothetical protein
MPRVGFEPSIPVFEQAKTAHASDRAAGSFLKQLATPPHSVAPAFNAAFRLLQFLTCKFKSVDDIRLQTTTIPFVLTNGP